MGFCKQQLGLHFWLAEWGIGLVHQRRVIGHHAAVPGRSDVEGLSGQGGGEDTREV
jgi:hypothetical protein